MRKPTISPRRLLGATALAVICGLAFRCAATDEPLRQEERPAAAWFEQGRGFGSFDPRQTAGSPLRDGPARQHHATSKDGLNFTRVEDVQIEGRRRWLGNAQSDGTVITFIGTGEPGEPGPPGAGQRRGGVWMATSSNGEAWKLIKTPLIPVADPGAVASRDGGWVVVGTGPPRPGTPGVKERPRAPAFGEPPPGQPRAGRPFPGPFPPGRPPGLGGDGPWNHRVLLATSKDGLSWTISSHGLKFVAQEVMDLGGSVSDTASAKGGWRTFFHVNANPQTGGKMVIRSAFTSDGRSWRVEEGDRVRAPEDGPARLGVADPAPLQLPDGTWLMALKSFIEQPPSPRFPPQPPRQPGQPGPFDPGIAEPGPRRDGGGQGRDGAPPPRDFADAGRPRPFAPPGQPGSNSPQTQSGGPQERAAQEDWPLAQGFNTLAAKIVSGKATADDKAQFGQLAEWLKNSGRGPWFDEVRVATSTDGLNFTDTRQTVLSKASVPEAVVDAHGNVWLFFVDADLDQWMRRVEAGGPFNTGLMSLGAAKSADGLHFDRVEMEIENVNVGKNVDPDIVVATDGTYHLYYLGVPANELAADTPDPARAPGSHKFYLATSRDLVHWAQQSVAWIGPHGGADPAVYRQDAKTWFIIGGGAGRSDDGGKTFQQIQMTTGRWGQPDVVGVNGGFRAYYKSGFSGIRSAFSKDSVTWTEEEGTRLPGGADPSVVRRKDGSWWMYYKMGGRPMNAPQLTGRRADGLPERSYDANPSRRKASLRFEPPREGFPPRGEIRVSETGAKYAVARGGKAGSFVTGQDADIVLGAKGFNNTGGPLLFNHPTGLATDGKTLLMTDRWNNRVLIWNSAPARNTPPELVLGQPDFTQNNPGTGRDQLNWPGNVAITPDGKVAVTDTNNDRILIWNSFPTKNGVAADLVLELAQLSGGGLAEFDQRRGPGPGQGGMRFGWPWGVWTNGKQLAVVATHGSAVLIWNALPARDNQPPDLVLCPSDAGTPRNVTSDGSTFFAVSDHNNGEQSRPATMVWGTFPTSSTQEPDFKWGEWMNQNAVVATDGKSLFVTSDFDRKMFVWRKLPDESGAKPDLVYSLPEGPWDNELHGSTLVLAGKSTVYIWRELPLNGELPDVTLAGSIGGTRLGEITGVAFDDRCFYVSDRRAEAIYVWEGIPTRDSEPKFTLAMQSPGRLNSDGHYLAAAPFEGGSISVWRVNELSSRAEPLQLGRRGQFNLPSECLIADGRVFVANRSFNRVDVWNRVEDALEGKPADALLGAGDEEDRKPEIGRNQLSMPGSLAWGGGYLWVGEFKFSTRILRFSPRPK